MVTSSVDVQVPLLMVQRKTYVDPFVPLKTLVGEVGDTNVPPAPLTLVHKPIPEPGVFAAKVAVVAPHKD